MKDSSKSIMKDKSTIGRFIFLLFFKAFREIILMTINEK